MLDNVALHLAIVLAVGFFIRSPLHLRSKWVGIDTFHNLIYALVFKRTKRMCQNDENMVYFNERYKNFMKYYPPLFYMMLSLFKKKHHPMLRFLPTAIDLVTATLIYFFAASILSQASALTASLIYIFSPISVLSVQSVGPRPISNLLFCISILMTFFYFSTSNLLFMTAFLISSSLVLLSNRLTTQSLMIVTLAESVVFKNFMPAIFLAMSFPLAFVLTGGVYGKVLKNHWDNLKRHFKEGDYQYGRIRPENPIKIFGSFPFLVIILLYTLNFGFSELLFFQVWFYSILFTSFFWIWGDAYRYLTNATFAGAILVSSFYLSLPFPEMLLLALFVVSFGGIVYMLMKFSRSKSERIINDGVLKCYDYIKRNSTKADTILTIPATFCRTALYFCGRKTVFAASDENIRETLKTGKIGKQKIAWVFTSDSKLVEGSGKFKKRFSSGKFSVYKSKS